MECNLSSFPYPDAIGSWLGAAKKRGRYMGMYLKCKGATQCSIVSKNTYYLVQRAGGGGKVLKWHFSGEGISFEVLKSGFRQNERKKNTGLHVCKYAHWCVRRRASALACAGVCEVACAGVRGRACMCAMALQVLTRLPVLIWLPLRARLASFTSSSVCTQRAHFRLVEDKRMRASRKLRGTLCMHFYQANWGWSALLTCSVSNADSRMRAARCLKPTLLDCFHALSRAFNALLAGKSALFESSAFHSITQNACKLPPWSICKLRTIIGYASGWKSTLLKKESAPLMKLNFVCTKMVSPGAVSANENEIRHPDLKIVGKDAPLSVFGQISIGSHALFAAKACFYSQSDPSSGQCECNVFMKKKWLAWSQLEKNTRRSMPGA
eukprot:1158588-Pelagomonas_calceolata.AAC.4